MNEEGSENLEAKALLETLSSRDKHNRDTTKSKLLRRIQISPVTNDISSNPFTVPSYLHNL